LTSAGYGFENADAVWLHDGLNLADLAHVQELLRSAVVPTDDARRLTALLLHVHDTPAGQFPYDAAFGEPYNSREHYFRERLGDCAGWLNAGRTRREAVRLALRIRLRSQLLDLSDAAVELARACLAVAGRHAETLMPDYTYLQQAQPSTFGHYLLTTVYPVLRDTERLLDAFEWVNSSPAGVGAVNGSRLITDRSALATRLGFGSVITHTRDAMWQIDGLIDLLSAATSAVISQDKLAEDLEIFASSEFNFVDVADEYSRSSIAMPQKRNPYALTMIRGYAGEMIGKLTGLLAVSKGPSARSDNYIFVYGNLPQALDMATRVTALTTGVVSTLQINAEAMAAALERGYGQATDIAEFAVQELHIDYRSAHTVVAHMIRRASEAGIAGNAITAAMLDDAAREVGVAPWHISDSELSKLMRPRHIVESRVVTGGAAPSAITTMVNEGRESADALADRCEAYRRRIAGATQALLADAQQIVKEG
jgi:argininosuccinate lyase